MAPAITRFLGWQHASGEGQVSADGSTFTGHEETDDPRSDGLRAVHKAGLSATRVTLG